MANLNMYLYIQIYKVFKYLLHSSSIRMYYEHDDVVTLNELRV